MKILAVYMILAGLAIGAGGAQECLVYPPDAMPFWVGAFAGPAGFFFALVGVLLWLRGAGVRRLVMLAGIGMAAATLVATVLGVMGVSATIIGFTSALAALGWSWKTPGAIPGT